MRTGIIIVIVVLLSVVGIGFFQYKQLEQGGVSANNSLSTLSTAFSASLSSADADISKVNELLSLLGQVSVLSNFDTGLFSNPAYTGLRDFSVTLFPAQSVGRKNPFLGIDESINAPKPATNATLNSSNTAVSSTSVVTNSGTPSPSATGSSSTNLSIPPEIVSSSVVSPLSADEQNALDSSFGASSPTDQALSTSNSSTVTPPAPVATGSIDDYPCTTDPFEVPIDLQSAFFSKCIVAPQ